PYQHCRRGRASDPGSSSLVGGNPCQADERARMAALARLRPATVRHAGGRPSEPSGRGNLFDPDRHEVIGLSPILTFVVAQEFKCVYGSRKQHVPIETAEV